MIARERKGKKEKIKKKRETKGKKGAVAKALGWKKKGKKRDANDAINSNVFSLQTCMFRMFDTQRKGNVI